MKRTKKLLALVLAMMMAFTALVLPAAAHGDEDNGVMPLHEVISCPICRNSVPVTIVPEYYWDAAFATTCSNSSDKHAHIPYRNYKVAVCGQCGHTNRSMLSTMYNVCEFDLRLAKQYQHLAN